MDTERWLSILAAHLGVELPADDDDLLDLTREVAHGIERKAGPLTTYLIGAAVAGGADPADVLRRVRALLPPVAL
jgi:hypothetical protein